MFDGIPVVNNLKFKNVVYRECMGKLYAFVMCVDVQSNGKDTGLKAYGVEL